MAWTSFGEIRGWSKPSIAEVPEVDNKHAEVIVYGIFVCTTIFIIVLMAILSWPSGPLCLSAFALSILTAAVVYLLLLRNYRLMAQVLDSLARKTELAPDEAVARVESALVAARMPYTRLSKEDPGRYWRDPYAETFTVTSGSTAHVWVLDERPYGTRSTTRVFVGPASVEAERLVSMLAWHLDKALREAKPRQ